MTDEAHLLVDRRADGVALLTLNRPAKRNALSRVLMAELTATLRQLGTEPAVRAVVLTGAPPAFSGGGDLSELRHADATAYLAYARMYRDLGAVIRDLPFPVIAAVNGAAVAGGFELMCLADIRVVADDAVLGTGDADLGLPTTSGLSWILPRLVGAGQARWLLMVSPRITGADAFRIGLAEESCPAGEVLERALAMAARVAGMPGDGIRYTRATVDAALESGYATAVAGELDAQREAFANPAVLRAIDAFFTNR